MFSLFLQSIVTGIEGIARNKVRAFLTSLGIIFGVASVITMLSIGKGAEKQILDELKFLGTNNLIIRAVVNEEGSASKTADADPSKEEEKERFSPGLTRKDGEAIAEIFPHIEAVSMETHMSVQAIKGNSTLKVMLVGQSEDFPKVNDFTVSSGNFFSHEQLEKAEPVCILGSAIAKRLFYSEDPLNKSIKCGREWLKIVGVASEKMLSEDQIQSLKLRNFGNDVYVPLKTLLLRFKDRSAPVEENYDEDEGPQKKDPNYHQLDRIVVKVDDTKRLNQLAEILSRYFLRRHNQVEDFEIEVPLQLMRQKEKTQDTFSFVLIAIASISLLVGGIGIMNIMLASVMERTREIGIRLAVGATKRDITLLFLAEAITLSIGGGLVGIILAFGLSEGISGITHISTIITPGSVLLSFTVAASVGIIFGWYPASLAAKKDPVESLRYE